MHELENVNSTRLLTEIQNKRENMIECALQTGYTSEDTIRHSQELDRLIYQFQRSIECSKEMTVSKLHLNYLMVISFVLGI